MVIPPPKESYPNMIDSSFEEYPFTDNGNDHYIMKWTCRMAGFDDRRFTKLIDYYLERNDGLFGYHISANITKWLSEEFPGRYNITRDVVNSTSSLFAVYIIQLVFFDPKDAMQFKLTWF